MAKRSSATKKRVVKKNIARGIVCISATFNNTNVTVTESNGQYLIAAEFEGILYGVSFDTKTSKIKTSTASLADL